VGGTRAKNQGRGEVHTVFWWWIFRERDHMENLDIDGRNFTFMWPRIVTNFFVMKPNSFRAGPDPVRKLPKNLYDIHHCWVYSE